MTSKELEIIMTRDEFDTQQTDMNVKMKGNITQMYNDMHIIFTCRVIRQLIFTQWKVLFSFYLLVSQLSDTPLQSVKMRTAHS